MIMQRRREAALLPAVQQAFSGGFGVDPWTFVRIGSVILNGLLVGKDIYEAVRGGKEAAPEATLPEDQITQLASQVAAVDPQKRSASQWESAIRAFFGTQAQPPPGTCPAGYIWDPVAGQCTSISRPAAAGKIPPWAWIAIGVGGAIFVAKSGLLSRPMGFAGVTFAGKGCRDKEGRFVPVPQCRNKRRKKA